MLPTLSSFLSSRLLYSSFSRTFLAELLKRVAGSSKIRGCDFRKPLCFQIDHYAGTVCTAACLAA